MLLIAAHPTRGVDVGAQAAIWEHIKRARREGLAVLLISADLDELIGLSDTIKVILRGELVGTFDPARRDPTGSWRRHDGRRRQFMNSALGRKVIERSRRRWSRSSSPSS